MAATRRAFLKTGIVAGTGAAVMPRWARASAAGFAGEAVLGPETTAASMRTGGTTRGIGIYPGAPEEFFGPEIVPDTSGTYRNLALRRPAFASSSYDYNLAAQLVTDGLVDEHLPLWVSTLVDGQVLPKTEREYMLSHENVMVTELAGTDPVVEVHLGGGGGAAGGAAGGGAGGGGTELPEVDRLQLFLVVPERTAVDGLRFTVSVSDDGHVWQKVSSAATMRPVDPADYPPDLTKGARILMPSMDLGGVHRSRYYRVELSANDGGLPDAYQRTFTLGQVMFYRGETRVNIGGPYSFTSAWKAAGLDEEWVSVDLGAPLSFDTVKLHWIARAAEGKVQVSDDDRSWRDLQALPAGASALGAAGNADEIKVSGEGRFVRVLMTRPATEHGYILSEMEVWGKGGFTARPHASGASGGPDGRMVLSGGGWKLCRGPQVQAAGEAIAAAGFDDKGWLIATVPGTTLTSYLNLGAIPDPNYGQNQLHVSDSYFYADFWYRTEFTAPAAKAGELQWLLLEGINWKAEVFLNGARLGRVDGAFTRGRFDVTGKLKPGAANALAILVRKNDTPGSCKQKTLQTTGKNGGALGSDNPTYHASIGWDWISTIRGRNTGVWAEVAVETTGAATLQDPVVTTRLPLPDVSHADVTVEVFAVNHTDKAFSGTLRGKLGTMSFSEKVSLGPNERKAVRSQLQVKEPRLWWPVGYGEPYLYDAELRLEGRGGAVDRTAFKAGLRQMTGTEEGGALRLFINGRRFVAKGGNWGFGESMLRYRAREYDAAVRYHREMNFTMIRNWVGQIGDDAFYEACDRHGVVVWQDFWLANPWDGPIPDDNAMFLANGRDFVSRIRKHASVGLYCGRNEWFPPKPLEDGIRQMLGELHPGLYYIGSSADGPVSGHGPYRALPAAEYFRKADTKLHSEIGAPAIPTIASVRAMMPERAVWPQSLDWGLHDFTMEGAQGGTAFRTLVDEAYGGATNAEDWIKLGEIVSFEAYRAMFESQSVHRMGVLLWMSHSCWPSFVWQTYDFYFAPTSSYFACKMGAEPLHIQWNAADDTVEVVNYSAGNVSGLTAEVEIFDLTGKSLAQQSLPVAQSAEDSTTVVQKMQYPAATGAGVQIVRLRLTEGGKERSTNFYLRGTEAGDFSAIRALPEATVMAETTAAAQSGRQRLTTVLRNTSQGTPALFVRVEALRASSGDRILPAITDAGYFPLMPGESRTVVTEIRDVDARGEAAKVVVRGLNVSGKW